MAQKCPWMDHLQYLRLQPPCVLQNLYHHMDEMPVEVLADGGGSKRQAIFMIGKHDKEYFVTSGNAIQNPDVGDMLTKLERINSLDKKGLKDLYRKIIKRDGGLTERGGAGLGFVDMARKSGRKLIFDFEPIDEELTFFSFKATIPRK